MDGLPGDRAGTAGTVPRRPDGAATARLRSPLDMGSPGQDPRPVTSIAHSLAPNGGTVWRFLRLR